MKGDIAIAGFYLTAEEWQALDATSRAALVAAATRKVVEPMLAVGSEPNAAPETVDEREQVVENLT
jgi:hypothetical protein